METLARRGKKQVAPEGLYDALIAVVDLLQKIVSRNDFKSLDGAVESSAQLHMYFLPAGHVVAAFRE